MARFSRAFPTGTMSISTPPSSRWSAPSIGASSGSALTARFLHFQSVSRPLANLERAPRSWPHRTSPRHEEDPMSTSDVTNKARELDARAVDGIDVRLFWHPATGALSVSVFEARHEQAFDVVVDADHAMDAFNHPYAYAALAA